MVRPLIQTLGLVLAPFSALFLASPAWAQPASNPINPTTRADPADARAAVPALVWRSSFGQPDAIRLPPALGWKEANDQVQRIGGWRAYARQAGEPDAPAAAPAPAAASGPAKPAGAMARPDTGHAGHSGHQKP